MSRILVINSSTGEIIAALGEGPNEDFLQAIDGAETLWFSRRISRVNSRILAKRVSSAPGQPPESWREGIDDYFVEKAASVRYWHQGAWRTAPGAD